MTANIATFDLTADHKGFVVCNIGSSGGKRAFEFKLDERDNLVVTEVTVEDVRTG